jgi:hypothetical protein
VLNSKLDVICESEQVVLKSKVDGIQVEKVSSESEQVEHCVELKQALSALTTALGAYSH